ncbi:hypothetical protein SRABI126_00110 [Pedobacter sp. Bi126]|nr:hypothetical protein SRABI126_00110 [Pedobacter sp. Bi126]
MPMQRNKINVRKRQALRLAFSYPPLSGFGNYEFISTLWVSNIDRRSKSSNTD